MLKIFKNEFLKFLYSKKIVFLMGCLLGAVIFFAVISLNFNKSHITIDGFMNSYFKGFLLSPVLPIILIIFSAQIVAEDYTLGCTKFFLISKLKKQDIINGKLLFLVVVILISLIFSFILSLVVGSILFKGFLSFSVILKNYIVCIPPLISLCAFTAFIALICDSFQNTLMISIGSYILMLILDSILESAKYFTITAVLSAGGNISNIAVYVISIAYLVLFSVLGMKIMKEKDVVL